MSTNTTTDTGIVGQIEGFVKNIIEDMGPEPQREGPGRPRILPSLALWAGMLVCVYRGFDSQLAIWRLLTQGDFWFYPRFGVSDQAVYKRLHQEGAKPLQNIFERVRDALAQRLEGMEFKSLAPFAKRVVAIDESTLDAVSRSVPFLRKVSKGDSGLLPGKLSAVFDVRKQQWDTIKLHANPDQNEKVGARELVSELEVGTLVVADLGYFSFAWFDWLTDRGLYWLSRLRKRTSYKVVHTYYKRGDTFDGIVWLGAHRADRAGHAVRLVQFRQGRELRRYITNVLEPERFSMKQMAEVYARRWDIEMAFKLIKEHLGLRLLWSAKRVVIYQQIWATLTISQVLQGLRLEIAHKARVDPFEVSMSLLVEYAPMYAYEGKDPVAVFVESGRHLRFIRPSRRTVIHAPSVAMEQMTPLPPGTELARTPRYAKRRCAIRTPKASLVN